MAAIVTAVAQALLAVEDCRHVKLSVGCVLEPCVGREESGKSKLYTVIVVLDVKAAKCQTSRLSCCRFAESTIRKWHGQV